MISRFQIITQDHPSRSHQEQALAACRGGADWVQVRIKNRSEDEVETIAREVQEICKSFGARMILNDFAHLVLKLRLDGVHLGKEDMNPAVARKMLGQNYIIGATANTWEDMQLLKHLEVNYFGVGPFRFTSTKEKLSPTLGLEGYKKMMASDLLETVRIPVIAIGGITENDVADLMKIGIHGIAVAGAVNFSEAPEQTVQKFLELIQSNTVHSSLLQ